jgi:hypothetical protein
MDRKIEAIIEQNAFIRVLAQLHGGALVSEASDELARAVEAVKKTGKKATLNVAITITPDGKGEVVAVEAAGRLKAALPQRDLRATHFFIGDSNELTRHDPNQPELQLVPVAKPAASAAAN